ncbi:MAG TPA: hypothetical protein VK527_10295 [Candidatus Limnocylindrales bacterium]|nr:hypothetical protein [Candidatus Limnocylindrales bacterium]
MIPALAAAVIPALVLPPLLLPLGNPFLFAVLPVAPLAFVYARAIAERKPRQAVTLALFWAAAVTISTVAAAAHSPGAIHRGIWHAASYRDEMLGWIATGVGAEGSIVRFLPRVLLEFAVVALLAAVSSGAGALLLGSLLLGYMNGYVGWVIANADPTAGPIRSALIAWPPWPMARVVAFILAGTAAAAWGYPRLYDRKGERPSVKPFAIGSLVFLAADVALKWGLAPAWRLLLRALLGASAGIEAGGNG